MQDANNTPSVTPARKSLGLSRRLKPCTPSPSPVYSSFSTPVSVYLCIYI